MKKTLFFFIITVLVLTGLMSCSTPTTPNATSTPNATQTAVAGLSYVSLVSVPGGTFTQTDETGTNSFSHTVSPFKLGQYEVTYELWHTVYQWAIVNGYSFAHAGKETPGGTEGAVPTAAKYQPVTTIDWRDVIVWCNALSQMTGLAAVYYTDAGFTTPLKDSTTTLYTTGIDTTPGSFDNPYVNWNAAGYRLPTEGEWQYAASYKDGSSWTPYDYASGAAANYADSTETGLVAWYNGNSGGSKSAAGGKAHNELDIYDMSGNVDEWCWDWQGNYPGTSTDYRGSASGTDRVLRGGNYQGNSVPLQVGYRNYDTPYSELYVYSFRIARNN